MEPVQTPASAPRDVVGTLTRSQDLQAALAMHHSANQTVLLDFTATWCGPCKKIKPVVHELAQLYSAQFGVYEVDVDEAAEIAAHFQVRSMPTFVFIRANKVVHIVVGSNPEELTKTMELVSKCTFPELLP
jgi:thioredoxin 1